MVMGVVFAILIKPPLAVTIPEIFEDSAEIDPDKFKDDNDIIPKVVVPEINKDSAEIDPEECKEDTEVIPKVVIPETWKSELIPTPYSYPWVEIPAIVEAPAEIDPSM